MSSISELQPLRIIQLSDTHLFRSPGTSSDWCEECGDIDTTATLAAVLEEVQLSEPYFNMFVVTGDIAQETAASTYERFDRMMHAESIPTWCIPGNHDDLEMMQQAFRSDSLRLNGHVEAGAWLLIFLDSQQPGEVSGSLGEPEFKRLRDLLELHTNKYVMIFLHHHPLPTGSQWLDEIGLQDSDQLLQLISQYDQVKALSCGHIHQELHTEWQQILVLGSPSTCVQFKPKQREFGLDGQAPGYRWLELHHNGSIKTGVKYLAATLRQTA